MVDLPYETLPGIDPAWSRWVTAPDADGINRRWHLLETGHAERGTMLLVHGNPTWSYLWRRFLSEARPGWRVIAVDQLGMGWSDHPHGSLEQPRGLAARLDDLDHLTHELGLLDSDTPVVAVGHDWGGIIAAGWAGRHAAQLGGLVLANTAVAHDFSDGLPPALRLARHPALLKATTVDTALFVRAATAVSSPRPEPRIRDAFAAPYRTSAERTFVGQFVADIPLEDDHPSRSALDDVAAGLSTLDVPALLLRGPRDPVFGEEHLRDLRRRLPHADVQRYEGAGHLVVEDAPAAAADVWDWVADRVEAIAAPAPAPPAVPDFAVGRSELPWARLVERAAETPDALAVAEVGTGRRITFAALESQVEARARGLRAAGVAPGDRVALLVPPGIDLTLVVYACWRAGAVIVVADKGLGLSGMGRALRGAGPAHVIGQTSGLVAARGMRVPGQRILVGRASAAARRLIGDHQDLDQLADNSADEPPMDVTITGDAECAVLFTSGATGPSKGVVYRVDALRTMIGHIGAAYRLGPEDTLVAAFAPFALYGPALGIGSVVPDVDVTRPASLTAVALADAVGAADATAVFASPAALRGVLATAEDLTVDHRQQLSRVRLLLSAGAPVPASLLRELGDVLPHATAHTPYGMTEALPVADISLSEITEAEEWTDTQAGVCVGRPLAEVQVRIDPFEGDELTERPGVSGEILVRGAHVKDRYDQLWRAQRDSADVPGWHRTGDVGHLDDHGRLWVEGRAVHVVHTDHGPVTPVAIERAVEEIVGVRTACVAGVGPQGAQQVVVVVVLDDDHRRFASGVVAPTELTDRVRERVTTPVAAVLVSGAVPVDIRHESKIDRSAVSRWATRVLAGERAGRL
ncbi:alpha/beta fold hydrolase [Propionibacteriaceae bacterium Y1685]